VGTARELGLEAESRPSDVVIVPEEGEPPIPPPDIIEMAPQIQGEPE
jgi:hypothetical protein